MRVFAPTVAAAMLLALSGVAEALNVKLHGLNYNSRRGPDWAPFEQRCKNEAEIGADMQAIKAITDSVRIYSLVDCDQGIPVARAAKAAGLKLALGIWTGTDESQLNNEITGLGKFVDAGLLDSNILGFHVGSEAIYRKDYSIDVAIENMNKVRAFLRKRGITIPMTVADVVDSYTQYPQLMDAVDYISINQFSFWEAVDISEGTATMLDRIKALRVLAAQKSKKIVIGETGWGAQGTNKNASIASPANQARFFRDFYDMARAHDMAYYWFVAFDSKWRVQNGDHEIEGYFGIYDEDTRVMKSNFQALSIGAPRVAKAVRNVGSQLLLTQSDKALSMSADSSEWLLAEQQTWFYDEATSTLRSKGNDRCLDTYQPYDGGDVRLYACLDGEKNQKWTFDAATKRLRHATYSAFCLDSDPAAGNKLQIYGCSENNKNQQWELETPGKGPSPTVAPSVAPTVAPSVTPTATPAPTGTPAPTEAPAPASDGSVRFFTKESSATHYAQLVRVDGEVGIGYGARGAANSQWWYRPGNSNNLVQAKDTNLCLDAYERWDGGRVHVWECNAHEPNQQWALDAATGQLRHLTHQGFCLDADQTSGKVALYWCHLSNNNQVWRKVSNVARGVRLHSELTSDAVLEPTAQDTVVGVRANNRDSQQWFFDAAAGRFVSKWRNECLDAYEGWAGGRVHTYACIDGEQNQAWAYDAAAFAVRHAKHAGFCLAYNDMNAKLLQLKACDAGDETQRIRVNAA